MRTEIEIANALDDADLFLRDRANSSPTPLNEYDIAIMLDIAKVCDEAARMLERAIVPPCKVGDTVWVLETLPEFDKCKNCEYFYEGGMGDRPACEKTRYGYRAAECIGITEVIVTEKQLYWWLYMNDFGKTVFLTREEAERALQRKEDEAK